MNSRNPDISVVIPVHNGETYLSMCLHALKASFHAEFETIVVDDGSR
ncbi:MAG: glycosyltransferase, partial [Candidatus Dadabacteria bacterium]